MPPRLLGQGGHRPVYKAHHAAHMGLSGPKDDKLMSRVREEDFTLVLVPSRGGVVCPVIPKPLTPAI